MRSGHLTKPIEAYKFTRVMDRLAEIMETPSRKEVIYACKDKGQVRMIGYNDILYFEKYRNNMVLHTTSQVIEMYKTMKDLIKELDPWWSVF